MKNRALLFIAVTLSLLSCKKTEEEKPVVLKDTLTLKCEQYYPLDFSKMDIDEGLTPQWRNGDQVWLSDGRQVCKAVVSKEFDGLTFAKVKYPGLSADSLIYALYPYDEDAYIVKGVVISSHKVVQDGTFDGCQTMYGVSDKTSGVVKMINSSALVEFYHNREDLQVMQVSNSSGERLSGNSRNIVVKLDGTGNKFFSTMPAILEKDSRFTFVTGDGRLGYFSTESDLNLSAGRLFNLGNIDDKIVMDASPAVDLSELESANCYMVSKPGSYKIKAVKGNGKGYLLDIAFADVLWETNNTDVAPACHSLVVDCITDGDYIYFRIPDGFSDGNALIAAFDEDGTVLWSWHLWLVADGIGEQTYSDESGVFSDAVMQDRNLGALTATAGKATSGGLLYQYGRKDPFFGSAQLNAKVDYGYASHYFDKLPVTAPSDESTGTIDFSVRNPQTCIFKGDNGHWLVNNDLTTWRASKKTIYDPCPAGYHIPMENALDGMTVNNTTWDASLSGRSITIAGQSIWFPSQGYRSSTTATLQYVGKFGYYWYDLNSSPNGYNCWSVCDTAMGNTNSKYVYALAYSVRCQKAESIGTRQTLILNVKTTVEKESFHAPAFWSKNFSGQLSWDDGNYREYGVNDTALFSLHKYQQPGEYSPMMLFYGADSLRITSLGNILTIDLSGL